MSAHRRVSCTVVVAVSAAIGVVWGLSVGQLTSLAAVASGASSLEASASAEPCAFVLGFAELRERIGASVVGDCIEDEHQVQGTNDAQQVTTNGVLFHRDIDDRNLFSTVTQTWIDGPSGLVTRPTSQRFAWEGDRQLVEALRHGGHVIYFRHGATDPDQRDGDPTNLADCATQRNLTDAGRAQARRIGDAFGTLGIPLGTVLSSAYCRALEYGRLAFDVVQPEPSLNLTDPLDDQQRAASVQTMQRLLATPPPPGLNTVLASHSPYIRLAADVDLPVEGEAAIFRVDAPGSSTLVARVLPADWPLLAQVMAPGGQD